MSDSAQEPPPPATTANSNNSTPESGNCFLSRLSSTLSQKAATSGSFISAHLQRKIIEALGAEVQPPINPALSSTGTQALLRQQAKTLIPVAADGTVSPVQTVSEAPSSSEEEGGRGGECSKTPITWEKVKAAGALIGLSAVLASLATLPLPVALQRRIFPLPLFTSALKLIMLLLYQLVVLKKFNFLYSFSDAGGLLWFPNFRVTYCSAFLATITAYLKVALSNQISPMLRLSLASVAPAKVILVEGGWSSDGSLGYNLVGGGLATLALSLVLVREVLGTGAFGLLFANLFWALVVVGGTVAPVLFGRHAPSGLPHPLGQILAALVTVVCSGLLLVVFKGAWPPGVIAWAFLICTTLAGVCSDVQAKKACCLLPQHGNLFWVLREVGSVSETFLMKNF